MTREEVRELARQMYEMGNSLRDDLAEFLDVTLYGEDVTDGGVNQLARAFLSAWIIEDAQPTVGSSYKQARSARLRRNANATRA